MLKGRQSMAGSRLPSPGHNVHEDEVAMHFSQVCNAGMSFEKHSVKTGSIIALRDKRCHFRGFHCPFNYPCSFSLILPVNYHFKSTADCCAGRTVLEATAPQATCRFTQPSHVPLQISLIRFVNKKKTIYNMDELISFIFLGYIFSCRIFERFRTYLCLLLSTIICFTSYIYL